METLCYQLVKDSWVASNDMSIVQKVKQCGETWRLELTCSFSKRIKECKIELKNMRSKRDSQLVLDYKKGKTDFSS